jgi:hypothetical protein
VGNKYGRWPINEVRELLNHIPTSCVDGKGWVAIGAAIHSCDPGPAGLAAFDDWSRDAPEYDRLGLERTWKGFNKPYRGRKPATVGSLVFLAQQHGYTLKKDVREAGRYVYDDDDGNHHLVTRLVKIDAQCRDKLDKNGKSKKSFPIKHWQNGKWENGAGAVKRVLYQAMALKTALAANETVFWVEGEKCADRLLKEGLPATTSMNGRGGATTLWQHDYGGRYFKTDNVVVMLPDNDTAGEDYINAVGAMLTAVGVKTRVLRLEGLGPGARRCRLAGQRRLKGRVAQFGGRGSSVGAARDATTYRGYAPDCRSNCAP